MAQLQGIPRKDINLGPNPARHLSTAAAIRQDVVAVGFAILQV